MVISLSVSATDHPFLFMGATHLLREFGQEVAFVDETAMDNARADVLGDDQVNGAIGQPDVAIPAFVGDGFGL